MPNIGIKPVRKGMSLVHPLDGPLSDDGGQWRDDQFTLRRMRDGDIKRLPDPDPESDSKSSSAQPSASAQSSAPEAKAAGGKDKE